MKSTKEYPINYFKEAFQLPINLVMLSIAFFVFLGSIILNFYFKDLIGVRLPSEAILSISIGLELIILAFVANYTEFQKNINKKYIIQQNIYNEELEIAEIITKLSKESLKRFIQFYQRKDQLIQKSIDSGANVDGILLIIKENTDKLTKSYAQHLLMNELYHHQISHSDIQKLKQELNEIQSELKNSEGKKKSLLQQRADLLNKRIHKLTTLREELSVAELQLKTIEDTLEYLYENSLTKSNINEFIETIDQIYEETETYQNALKEIQELV